jgi:hypothetical protein
VKSFLAHKVNFAGSMTDPMDPQLEDAAKKSKTDPRYSTMHKDDNLAYQSIKNLAEAIKVSVPTFEQVRYQRNLEALRDSNEKAREKYFKDKSKLNFQG